MFSRSNELLTGNDDLTAASRGVTPSAPRVTFRSVAAMAHRHRRTLGKWRPLVAVIAVILVASCSTNEPLSEVDECVQQLREMSERTGAPLGDAEEACADVLRAAPDDVEPSPTPSVDPRASLPMGEEVGINLGEYSVVKATMRRLRKGNDRCRATKAYFHFDDPNGWCFEAVVKIRNVSTAPLQISDDYWNLKGDGPDRDLDLVPGSPDEVAANKTLLVTVQGDVSDWSKRQGQVLVSVTDSGGWEASWSVTTRTG